MPNGEILPDWYYLDTGAARVLIFSTGFPTFPASRVTYAPADESARKK